MSRHDLIKTVFQISLLRVLDHRCIRDDDAHSEIPQQFEIYLPRSGAFQRWDAHGAFLAGAIRDQNSVI